MPFKSPTLSHDVRLVCLLRLAIRNLVNIQNLRILHGHWLITVTLLVGFFDRRRHRVTPVRKLWLENCCIGGIFQHEQNLCDFNGLESVRFRRMRLANDPSGTSTRILLMRGGIEQRMHNGKGGDYYTTMHDEHDISTFFSSLAHYKNLDVSKGGFSIRGARFFRASEVFDRFIYGNLPEITELVKNNELDEYFQEHEGVLNFYNRLMGDAEKHRQIIGARAAQNAIIDVAGNLLAGSSGTLTNLNLDWVFLTNSPTNGKSMTVPLLERASKLRFPNLRSFQLRNQVTNSTMIFDLVSLLGTPEISFIDFMEAHQSLKCLGWPMALFFTTHVETPDVKDRVDRIIESLSQSIIDLRVDAEYNESGEPKTDHFSSSSTVRTKRRLFITNFASRMQNVEHIKIEGCVPRDERRETLRALRKCRLQRIISIGVSSPLGNTWGEDGIDFDQLEEGPLIGGDFLEAEDTDAVTRLATSPLEQPEEPYTPTFGWGPSPPILHTIASYHAATVTELKFCGYQGSPVLGTPTKITESFLHPLRHFHNLRQLVLSMWICTFFEDSFQDRGIISYWLDRRDSSSTALVPVSDEASGSWAQQIKIRYAPEALARQVQEIVAKHLSPRAKEKRGGVNVRASFSLGESTNNIFDLDVRIGRNDEILAIKGPREELEPERRTEKLESRRWF